MAMLSYTVLLVPDPDPNWGGFTVTVPKIPEIVTEGDDGADALAMVREAIALGLSYAIDEGFPVPVERETPRLRLVGLKVAGARGVAPVAAGAVR